MVDYYVKGWNKIMANEKIKKANGADSSKTDIWYKILSVAIVIILIAGALIAVIKPTGIGDYISMHTSTALESENFKFNNAHVTYMVYYEYNQTYSQYSQYGYASSAGLDTSKPLSQQKYWGSEQSWLDYFLDNAVKSLKQCLVLCEEAKANNVELTEDEYKAIKDQVKQMKEYAKEQGVSLGQMYGSKGIKASDIEYLFELQELASKYSKQISESFTFTDAQYEEHYGKNENKYKFFDHNAYTITAEYEKDATDAQKSEATKKAKEAIDAMKAAIEGGKSFAEAALEYEKTLKKDDSSDKEEEKTDEQLLEDMKKTVFKERASYVEDDEFSKWIYGENPPKENEMKIIEGTESYTLYQVLSTPEREEYNTANFYVISLNAQNYEDTSTLTAEQVMKETATKVQEKIDAFNASASKKAEDFPNIAKDFAEKDYVSASEIIENIGKNIVDGQFGIEGFDDWAFAEATKAGDVKVFENEEDGIYVAICYAGEGLKAWTAAVDSDMRSESYEAAFKALEEKYNATIVTNQKALDKIA